ncbi:MAG: DNA-deoxyinosine glycosylase [Gammaproteobacteria bacterium]|nr:DNA-deoxyinosine glycosylase [Gammaproteobacteria bacterium]
MLGTMPGIASLAAGEYYAHSHNAFWRIMAELLAFDFSLPYSARVRALKSARIAVWDVLQSCTRPGSMDASIEQDSAVANDFGPFFNRHKRIYYVYFNGATAERLFRAHVQRKLGLRPMNYQRLPSTSPANASKSFRQKLRAWCKSVGHHAR